MSFYVFGSMIAFFYYYCITFFFKLLKEKKLRQSENLFQEFEDVTKAKKMYIHLCYVLFVIVLFD